MRSYDIPLNGKTIKMVVQPLHTIKPYENNVKDHPVAQLQGLTKSLDDFGFKQPIVIDKNNVIVAGHARYEAAATLGYVDLLCVSADDLTEKEINAYRLLDNEIAKKGTTNIEALNIELAKLPDFDFKEFNIDFPKIETINEGLCDADEIPEFTEKPKTKLGDIWILGNHSLMCGNSEFIDDINKLILQTKIDLILTDPPYGISVVKADGNIGGERKGKNGYGQKGQYGKEAACGIYEPIIGDDQPFDPFLLLTLAPQQIIFGANNFASKLPDNSHWLVWIKDMPEGTDFSGAELAWTNVDKKAVKTYKFTWAGMTRSGNRKDELSKRVHPTQKPVGLFVNILKDHECVTVLDLYGGSGTTLIACEKINRICFMMELSPAYCDVIVNRWQKFTGKDAILASTKQKYSEVSHG